MIARRTKARFGDVRGIRQVLETLRANDARSAAASDAVTAAVAAVEGSSTPRASCSWRVGAGPPRAGAFVRLHGDHAPLTIFRARNAARRHQGLAGSPAAALANIQRQIARALMLLEQIMPPEECRAAHAMLVSAAHLADNAAKIRREAALAGDIARAWDASSAAAGALMLGGKARAEIQAAVNRPQLQ